jgi:hypothetical protein
MEFTEKIKNDWIAGMESGEYKKTDTHAELYRDGCFCALGVLCMTSGIVKKGDEDLLLFGSLNDFKPYEHLEDLLTENISSQVYRANDKNEGDNFAAAIKLVKGLETVKQ